MTSFRMMDVNNRFIGYLLPSTGRVRNSDGKTVYRLGINDLYNMDTGDHYFVTPLGQVVDINGRMVAFIENYTEYEEASKSERARIRMQSEQKEANKSMNTTTAKNTSTSNAKWLFLVVILVAGYFFISSNKIVGTWEASRINSDGLTISYSNYQALMGDYDHPELKVSRDGTWKMYMDGQELHGTWEKISEDRYSFKENTYNNESTFIYNDGELAVQYGNGILYWTK